MSFTSVTTQEIAAGEPTSNPLFDKIRQDLDDLNTRVADAQAAAATTTPIEFLWNGLTDITGTGLMFERVFSNMTLRGVKLYVDQAGSSGILEIDIQYKRGAGAWMSILTSPLDANQTSGSNFTVAAASLAVTSLLAGDLLRINVNSVQAGGKGFAAYVEYDGAA